MAWKKEKTVEEMNERVVEEKRRETRVRGGREEGKMKKRDGDTSMKG